MSITTHAALHDIMYPGNQVTKSKMTPCVVPDPKARIIRMTSETIRRGATDAKIVDGYWYVEFWNGWFKLSDLLKNNKHY